VATPVQSLDQFVAVFGTRQAYSLLYDAVETFFREGGGLAYIARVVGPAATVGTKQLLDVGAAVSLTVNANGPGAWSSSYKVGVIAGGASGSYQIQVTDNAGVTLEQSGDLLTQGAAVSWSQYSQYVRIVLGASALNPAPVAAAALSAGADDRTNITETQWTNALALFTSNLGPGQVSQPGRTTSVAYGQIKAHVEANGRVGLLDLPDSATPATVKSAALGVTSRFCAAFAPWCVVAGVTAGTVRTVPPSGFIAGLIAKNDPAIGTNTPSAGNAGVAQFVTDISQPDWDDITRTDLNNNYCNVIRRMFGGIRNYGWRSCVVASNDPNWVNFGNSRLYVDIQAELNAAAEDFVFRQIDGQNGYLMNSFNNALSGILINHYQRGELFGSSASQAFVVDTGPAVNTLATLANNELHAVCRMKMSPFAEYVVIQIVKRQITQVL